MASAQTPLMKQYRHIKAEYEDCILFFRLGDFYEMFFEDAEKAAPILDIALTCRDKKAANPIPLCGVPYHSANGYISKLLDQGLNVAVCEQIEDASVSKGLVKRDVVRVITPSMRTETEGLSPTQVTCSVAIYPFEINKIQHYALAWLDISGGNFKSSVFSNLQSLENEVWRLNAKEILLPKNKLPTELVAWQTAYQSLQNNAHFHTLETWIFEDAQDNLCQHFELSNLHGLGLSHNKEQAACSYALLYYAQTIRKNKCSHLDAPKNYSTSNYLHLDRISQSHLDLFPSHENPQHSLYDLLHQCKTKAGSRMLANWMHFPLNSKQKIEARLQAVSTLYKKNEVRQDLQDQFKLLCDFERLSTKLINQTIKPLELHAIAQSIDSLPQIKTILTTLVESPSLKKINDNILLQKNFQTILSRQLEDEPGKSLQDGNIIKTGFSKDLDELRDLCNNGKDWLNTLELREKEQTGIGTLKVRFNKVFGYYIEVSKSYINKVPEHFIRKQTLVNAERYITEELKEYEVKVLSAQDQRLKLEQTLYNNLMQQLVPFAKGLKDVSQQLSQLDILTAFADVAVDNSYVCPTLHAAQNPLHIKAGRHPMLEKHLQGHDFVANDMTLDHEQQQMIILTGPNMSGKSTIMRQVALIAYMAHLGCFVPAEQANIPMIDQIFTRVGTGDDLAQGRSTFMVEMNETAKILRNASKNSLIILDEVGRGTSTYDGLALAWAVSEYLHDATKALSIFATHYHELTELPLQKQKMQNFHVRAKLWEDKIIFMHCLKKGPASQSYGLEVAKMAGVIEPVLVKARKILNNLEKQQQVHVQSTLPFTEQLPSTQPHPIVEDIKKLNANELSPKQALDLIYSWKNKC